MKRYRWSDITADVIVPASVLAALVASPWACMTDRVEPVICASGLACAPGWVCAPDGQSCSPGTCGDGRLDAEQGEICDYGDGAEMERNGCTACLILEKCGNGALDPGESCDDGNDNPNDGCDGNCRITVTCGDGIVNPPAEQCDEGIGGVRRATATCNENCTVPWCGDGVINPHYVHPATGLPERCEPRVSAEPCDADCTPAECGDGVLNVEAGELCDDGNQDDADGCVACQPAECGDGTLWRGVEECETRADTATCDADCTSRRCGDGYLNAAAGEICDDGNDFVFDDCVHCQPARCGDGFIELGKEQCDDGNEVDTDDCPSGPHGSCQMAYCGDGLVRAGHEHCDSAGDSMACDSDCTPVVCGDGHVNVTAGEECENDNDRQCPGTRCTDCRCGA